MSVLAIDVGNSRVGLAVLSAGKSKDAAVRFHHGELDKELPATLATLWKTAEAESTEAGDEETAVVVASVVPKLAEGIEAIVSSRLGVRPIRIGRDLRVPLKTALREGHTAGQDRLLGALAAYVNVEKACVVIQAGSALVVDCVDDEGVFRGGAIMPGLQMSAKALHDFAAQLPNTSLTPPEDAEPFGRFTQEAINLGLYVGARGAVRELLERYATALGAWPHVVATGGDAQALFASEGGGEIVDSFVPDLVLQGAALTWEHHNKHI